MHVSYKRARHGKTFCHGWSCLPTHTSVGRTSGCDIEGPGSISICNLGNLLDVFKLLAIEQLKGCVFEVHSGTESLSLLRTRLLESNGFNISFHDLAALFSQPSLSRMYSAFS